MQAFKYLGLLSMKSGSVVKEVNENPDRMEKCFWSDKKVTVKVKGNVDKRAVRPAMPYGL